MRTAQKEQSAEELVEIRLSAKVKRFIAEYLKDNNTTSTAARAGYRDPNYGRQLIANPNVAQASGMPVYMVAIQQGGQLRDSFGGVGNALKAMLSIVTPARVAIGGLAGAVLIAAKAGSDYFTAYDEINKAITGINWGIRLNWGFPGKHRR